jgi:hypothetical protein
MDRTDLELFERSLGAATSSYTGAALDAALHDLGWRDALASDPRDAVATLFKLQGAANATSSALDLVVLDALGVAGGRVVMPPIGSSAPPGTGNSFAGLGSGSGSGDAVVVTDAGVAIVSESDLRVRTISGLDPRLGLVAISGEVALAGLSRVAWTNAVRVAHLALGHELVGASRRMLELARAHALEREQFGRPIAQFQAVRHRLAETHVAIEAADAMLDAAWLDEAPESSLMAKALAGRGARTAAKHCQQVLAGIGFTTEHELHNYIRRVLVLDELFGSTRTLTTSLGTDVLASKKLPALLPL